MSGFLVKLFVIAVLVNCTIDAERIKSRDSKQIRLQNGDGQDLEHETLSENTFYNNKNMKKRDMNSEWTPENAFMDPSILSEAIFRGSEFDKHMQSKILQPISPFEDSNLEVHLLDNEDLEKDNLRNNEYGSSEMENIKLLAENEKMHQNLGDKRPGIFDQSKDSMKGFVVHNLDKEKYIVNDDVNLKSRNDKLEEARYTIDEDGLKDEVVQQDIDFQDIFDTSNMHNISYDDLVFSNETNIKLHSGMGLEHSSSAEAKLIVNNVTVKDFYEDRFNNSNNLENSNGSTDNTTSGKMVQGSQNLEEFLKNGTKISVGVVEHYDADNLNQDDIVGSTTMNSDGNIRHLDDFLNYLMKNKNISVINESINGADFKLGNAFDTSSFDKTKILKVVSKIEEKENSGENMRHLDDFLIYLRKNENSTSIGENMLSNALDTSAFDNTGKYTIVKENADGNTEHLNDFINYLIKNENGSSSSANENHVHEVKVGNALDTSSVERKNSENFNNDQILSTDTPIITTAYSDKYIETSTEFNAKSDIQSKMSESIAQNSSDDFTNDFVFPEDNSEFNNKEESLKGYNKIENTAEETSAKFDSRNIGKLLDNPAFDKGQSNEDRIDGYETSTKKYESTNEDKKYTNNYEASTSEYASSSNYNVPLTKDEKPITNSYGTSTSTRNHETTTIKYEVTSTEYEKFTTEYEEKTAIHEIIGKNEARADEHETSTANYEKMTARYETDTNETSVTKYEELTTKYETSTNNHETSTNKYATFTNKHDTSTHNYETTTNKYEEEHIINKANTESNNQRSNDYPSETNIDIDDYGVNLHAGTVDVNINKGILDAIDSIFHHDHYRTPETEEDSSILNEKTSLAGEKVTEGVEVSNSTTESIILNENSSILNEGTSLEDGKESEDTKMFNSTKESPVLKSENTEVYQNTSEITTESSAENHQSTKMIDDINNADIVQGNINVQEENTTIPFGENYGTLNQETTPITMKEKNSKNSDEEPYVIHTVTIGENDQISELRSDLHASLDDIAQRMIARADDRGSVFRTSCEELEIINITADATFKYGEGIQSWKSLTTANKIYLLGTGLTEIALLQFYQTENNILEYKLLQTLPLQKPNSFDFFNLRIKTSLESIAIISIENEIFWYKIGNPEDNLVKIWRWVLHSKINFVKFFELDDNKYIFTLEYEEDNQEFVGNLYGFSIDHKDFWLRQRMNLDCEATMADFSFVADFVYLAVPLKKLNQVAVYKFVDGRFVPQSRLESADVDFVSAFSVGHKNFLALGGLDHAIYRLDIHGIHKEAVLDSTFDKVQFYLPIHVRNYRDDLIVLVQHEIDHESHSSLHIEALIWTEDGFVTSPHELCDDHGDISYGFQCLIDEETDTGIIGSAIIQQKHTSSLIIPRIHPNSELYTINTKLVPTEDPNLAELNSLRKIKEKLEQAFIHQTQIVEQANKILQHSLNPQGDNIVKDKWTMNELHTSVYHEENAEEVQWTDGFLTISDIKFNKTDLNIHIPTLMEESAKSLASVLDMPQILKDAVKINSKNVKLAHDLTVAGELKIEGGWKAESICVGDINGEKVKDLFQRLMYNKQTVKYDGAVKFDKIFVDNLIVDTINDVPVSSILQKSPEVFIQGNLEFLEDLEFDKVYIKNNGALNGIQFQDIQRADVKIESLVLDEAVVKGDFKVKKFNGFVIDDEELSDATNGRYQRDIGDNKEIRVLGDMKFDSINGLVWKDLVSQVVWKNAPRMLEHKMSVKGNIVCPEPCLLHMPNINGLAFPSDLILTGVPNIAIHDIPDYQTPLPQYVMVPNSQLQPQEYDIRRMAQENQELRSDNQYSRNTQETGGPETISIVGKKSFNRLNVGSLDCPGLVNGLAPEDVITLQGEQHIKGPIAFENLKVTEGLHVGGKLTGKYLDNFTTNPTLKDSNIISSSTIFRHLEIQGPIFVQNVNDSNLETILNDVVYKNEEDEVVIHGFKQFENTLTVIENIELTSNRINSIDTSSILTKDTEQILTVENVKGNIEFHDLTIDGFIDEVNVTDIYINAVKLQGDQYVSSDITFDGHTSFAKLLVDDIYGKSAKDLYTIDELIYLGPSVQFDKIIVDYLYADNVYVENNILNNRNLTVVLDRCLSLNHAQDIDIDFYIDSVNTNDINSKIVEIIPPEIGIRKKRNTTIFFDDEEIEELIVEGSITTGTINGYDFKDIVRNAVWLNKENYGAGHMVFMDGFTVSEINAKGTVNEYDFNGFIEDVVLASDNVKIDGKKIFEEGLVVDNVNANMINSIDVKNILTKNTEQSIYGEFVIDGDVTMDELACSGRFNGEIVEDIKHRYTFEDGWHVIHGDAVFSKPVYIKSLTMDQIKNIDLHEFLTHLVTLNDHSSISANLVFENEVIFENNIHVSNHYNGLNFNQFMEDVVLVDRDSIIDYPIIFEENVVFAGDLKFNGDVNTATVSGCDLEFWKENRISTVDGGKITGKKIFFDVNAPMYGWTTRLINGRNWTNIFTTNTDQDIPDNLFFSTLIIEGSCVALGTVNGKNLAEEFANTLMTTSDKEQVIEAATNFSVVHVRDFMQTSAPVNQKYNLQNPFTLHTDQDIVFAGHVFAEILTPYLDINGTTAGIGFDEWIDNALRRSGNDQVIKGRWTIDTADFQSNIVGNLLLNNRDIHDLADEVAKQKLLFDIHKQELQDEYISFCSDIQYLLELSQKSLYLLKYFEETQFLSTPNIVSSLLYEDSNGHSIIMNYGGCKSTIFKWISKSKKFQHAYSLETGAVDEWISVKNQEGSRFLVSKSDGKRRCKFASGANVWYVDNGTRLKHLFELGDGIKEILQGVEGMFYTVDETGVKEYTLRSYGDQPVVSGKWNMYTDGSTFVPREAGFDLSLSDGKTVTKLIKNEPDSENAAVEMFGSEPIISRSVSASGISTMECPYLPRRGAGEVRVLTVGLGSSLRQLVAVSVLENATVHGNHDFIKIYDDVMEGRLFQTLSCVRPSSLVSIHFGQGQTILAFIEDESNIQIYDYRGIEGFVHLYSLKFPATSLAAVELPVESKATSWRFFLLASGSQGLRVLEALMYGDRVVFKDDLQCRIP